MFCRYLIKGKKTSGNLEIPNARSKILILSNLKVNPGITALLEPIN